MGGFNGPGAATGFLGATLQPARDCGCECSVFRISDDFTGSPIQNPDWLSFGHVTAIPFQGGAWRLDRIAPDFLTLVTGQQRTLAFVSNSGALPDPPLSFKGRAFFAPGDIVNGVFAAVGLADLAHGPDNPVLAFIAFDVGSGLEWQIFFQDNANPSTLTPTGVLVGQTCETAQVLEIVQTSLTTAVFKIDGVPVGSVTLTAALKSHLFAPTAVAQANDPMTVGGSLTLDSLCASEGRVCLTDPGDLPFTPPAGDWIQSGTNAAGADFSTNDTVNWTTIVNIGITAIGGTKLSAWASIASENDTVGAENQFRVTIDGNPIPFSKFATTFDSAGTPRGTSITIPQVSDPPFTAGAHTVALEWKVTAGTGKILAGSKPDEENAVLMIAEVAI